MAQLRSRAAESKDSLKTTKATAVKKRLSKKRKNIIQTFTAKDIDTQTVKLFPKTQKERNEYVNEKTGKRVTPFQFKVYDLVAQIPKGQVTSYKVLSETLKSHPRAVGQALRVNPFCPLPIPCHRVIATDYSLGGFNGGSGDHQFTADKKAKLESEGSVFNEHYMYKHDINGSNEFYKGFSVV